MQRPGEPGDDTWGDLPLNKPAGERRLDHRQLRSEAESDVLVDGQAEAVGACVARRPTATRSTHNSTLALDPDTGKMVWYYQFTPGETHDIDDAFENMLIDHDGRHSLFKMGKLGILWELDRKTGKFISCTDLGFQTLVEFDPTTGKAHYPADMIPEEERADPVYCPGAHRRPQLAGDGVSSRDPRDLHPDSSDMYPCRYSAKRLKRTR